MRDSDSPAMGAFSRSRYPPGYPPGKCPRRAFVTATHASSGLSLGAGVPGFSPHDLRHRRVSLLHLAGSPWARIGELVGHGDLVTTARTNTHVVADEAELDYTELLS